MAVVKANAYGHGAARIASELEAEGIRFFMVATLAEGLALRRSGLISPILVATPPHPNNLVLYAEHGLHASIVSESSFEELIQSDVPVPVHLKVDTGMSRLGVSPQAAPRLIQTLTQHATLNLAGLWTHLATASSPDTSFALQQIETIRNVYETHRAQIPLFHVGNSAALLHLDQHLDRAPHAMFRVGGALLGMSPLADQAENLGLKPVLSLKSRILQVKRVLQGTPVSYGGVWKAPTNRWIGTIGIGYADGFPSRLADSYGVRIGARDYQVVGSVCMDMIMIDLGDATLGDPDVQVYDEVTIFGHDHPKIRELGRLANRKPYEICCSMSGRVPRIYV